MSRETWFHIAYHSSAAVKALGSGFPLIATFGDLSSIGKQDAHVQARLNAIRGIHVNPRDPLIVLGALQAKTRAFQARVPRTRLSQYLEDLHQVHPVGNGHLMIDTDWLRCSAIS
ncbi:hypothetical protein SISSUDRAFT_571334 [Sistotremastrum suecicum HHB10207 ss-3]|uniref:Uncharacterized protein n=1 Tax=Sistotremastrum suecicum HHB10207 ss-3 TaxID=1314776 RepID=A0A166ER59_9AGAM|nr:hypothetical protein SISSUDRAFT_571334 [Sistotremastrum suecicum HHB10207 ss-3]